ARTLPSDPRIARVSQRLRELRRLAAVARQQSLANLDGNPESIAVYPWPEEEDVVRVEDHSVARRLTERLAPPAPDTALDHRSSHNETFAELLREGEDLRALGRLLKLDLTPYGNQLSKALAAARAAQAQIQEDRLPQLGDRQAVIRQRVRDSWRPRWLHIPPDEPGLLHPGEFAGEHARADAAEAAADLLESRGLPHVEQRQDV